MKKKRERTREYGVSLDALAFGSVEIQLQFDDIIETEDSWEPVPKSYYGRKRCQKLYERNSTMELRKGLRILR